MKKKIERAADFLAEQVSLFRCPLCHENFQTKEHYLTCKNHHRFDLSKKGTIYFLKHAIQTEYTEQMFTPRGRIIMAGQYNPVIEKISAYLESENKLLDVGCGEGSFVRKLTEGGHTGTTVGFDISKEGIYLATNQPLVENIFWCVADLTNLPFANHSFDTILNIFSPSQYKEFSRVLKPDGKLIKIIPDEFYLTELRRAYFPENLDKQVYSNQKVIDKFQEEMMVEHVERITYTFDIPEDLRLDFLDMSPLEWSVEPDRKAQVRQNPLEQITIDVNLLIGTPRL